MSIFASAGQTGPNTALKRALRELSTAPAPGVQSQKQKSAGQADEARSQQLRGIFAAFDEDRDGLLSEEELKSALLSLSIDPTQVTLSRFARVSPLGSRAIDFTSVCVLPSRSILSIGPLDRSPSFFS